jgi:hypothetical protein
VIVRPSVGPLPADATAPRPLRWCTLRNWRVSSRVSLPGTDRPAPEPPRPAGSLLPPVSRPRTPEPRCPRHAQRDEQSAPLRPMPRSATAMDEIRKPCWRRLSASCTSSSPAADARANGVDGQPGNARASTVAVGRRGGDPRAAFRRRPPRRCAAGRRSGRLPSARPVGTGGPARSLCAHVLRSPRA